MLNRRPVAPVALVVVAVELQVDAAQAPVNEVVVVVDLEEAPPKRCFLVQQAPVQTALELSADDITKVDAVVAAYTEANEAAIDALALLGARCSRGPRSCRWRRTWWTRWRWWWSWRTWRSWWCRPLSGAASGF